MEAAWTFSKSCAGRVTARRSSVEMAIRKLGGRLSFEKRPAGFAVAATFPTVCA